MLLSIITFLIVLFIILMLVAMLFYLIPDVISSLSGTAEQQTFQPSNYENLITR